MTFFRQAGVCGKESKDEPKMQLQGRLDRTQEGPKKSIGFNPPPPPKKKSYFSSLKN